MEILFRPGSSGPQLQHNLYIHQELIHTYPLPPLRSLAFFFFSTNAQSPLRGLPRNKLDTPRLFITFGPSGMSEPTATQPTKSTTDPLASYTRSLYNYTLALWTESRRVAEEKARVQGAANTEPDSHYSRTPLNAYPSVDGPGYAL
jgi:hypothetical protein